MVTVLAETASPSRLIPSTIITIPNVGNAEHITVQTKKVLGYAGGMEILLTWRFWSLRSSRHISTSPFSTLTWTSELISKMIRRWMKSKDLEENFWKINYFHSLTFDWEPSSWSSTVLFGSTLKGKLKVRRRTREFQEFLRSWDLSSIPSLVKLWTVMISKSKKILLLFMNLTQKLLQCFDCFLYRTINHCRINISRHPL